MNIQIHRDREEMSGSLELRVVLERNGVDANGYWGSLGGYENVLILTMVMVAQLSEYTKTTLNT